jgi:hypothetical protein
MIKDSLTDSPPKSFIEKKENKLTLCISRFDGGG